LAVITKNGFDEVEKRLKEIKDAQERMEMRLTVADMADRV